MSHKHFTINKRNKLEVLLKENYKIARIAEILEKDKTTIYREIKRVKGEYCAEKAQINANNKGCKKGRNYKITSELKNLIESKLCERWSPEQIVGPELKGKLSFKVTQVKCVQRLSMEPGFLPDDFQSPNSEQIYYY